MLRRTVNATVNAGPSGIGTEARLGDGSLSATPPSCFDESLEPIPVEAERFRADLHGGGSERRLRQPVDLGFRDL